MRKHPTKAEAALYEACARRAIFHLPLRRQEIMRGYIVDFYVAAANLVIEVDGPIHDGRKEYDAKRDSVLRGLGFEVLRFKNEDVFNRPKWVVERIRDAAFPRLFLPTGKIKPICIQIWQRRRRTWKQKQADKVARKISRSARKKAILDRRDHA